MQAHAHTTLTCKHTRNLHTHTSHMHSTHIHAQTRSHTHVQVGKEELHGFNKELIYNINIVLGGSGNVFGSYEQSHRALDAIVHNIESIHIETSYLVYVQKINGDKTNLNNLVNQIHYLYALWITEYDRLLYLYNITANHVPSSLDLIGFILALKTTQDADGKSVVGIDDRYEEIFRIIQGYQNTARTPEGVRQGGINIYNDIFTYYAYNLNENKIHPEVTTAVIFAYLDYKTNSDILLFKFPQEVNDLLPNNQLLSKNDWDTFYNGIVPFFAAFHTQAHLGGNNRRKGGTKKRNKINTKKCKIKKFTKKRRK